MLTRQVRNPSRGSGASQRAAASQAARVATTRRFTTGVFVKASSINPDKKSIQVNWSDSHVSKFHNVWLRDHCRCPKCVEPSSGQKLRTRASLPDDLAVASLNQREAGLDIEWRDGHKSSFAPSWLRDNCYSKATIETRLKQKQQVLWNRSILAQQGGIPIFQFADVMASDKHVWNWMQALNKFGLALVKNVPTQEGAIKDVAERIAYLRNTMYGLVWDVKSVPNPINVAYTSVELPPHQDLCYYEAPPGLQLLHCLKFEMKAGGNNTFVDGFWACEELRRKHPESFKTLSTHPTEFYKFDHKNMMRYSRPIIVTDQSSGELVGLNWSPNFEAPLRLPEEHVENFYKAYSEFTKIVESPESLSELRLAPGDLISFNNRRTLHARTAFDETAGVRHLQGIYIDLDEYSNRYRTLERQFAPGQDTFARNGNFSH